jgi:hypothetical protein
MTHMTLCDAGDRLKLVKASTDKEWLGFVVRDPNVQKSVRIAAERRWSQL